MTGGLQEQVTDGEEWFGFGIEPASKAIIGSQIVPFIYEDRVCEKDVVDALLKMYNLTKEEREEMGKKGREHILTNYGFKRYVDDWDKIFTQVYNEKGSWKNRKNYEAWKLIEVT